MKRAVIIAKGDVQRVGYREAVVKIARRLELSGFVENLKPYDVKIVVDGEEDILNEFVTQIKVDKYPVYVKDLDVEFEAATGEFEYFEIKRSDWMEELGERLDVAGTLLYTSVELGKETANEIRKFDEDIGTMRRELVREIGDQISTLRQETMKFGEDLDTMRSGLVGEIREQISTLRQERLLLFEKEMLSDMHENFERYDSKLQRTLKRFPHEKSVFIMMPFEENDIRLKKITDTINETLKEQGLRGWRADDPERSIMEDIWDNIVVNMLSCKYGIAVFVDRTVLDRYSDEQITVFNANIAHVLLLKDNRLEKLPTDIISKLYEPFDFNDPEGGVKKAVTKWIERCKSDEMHK
jgi:acylphosphatase